MPLTDIAVRSAKPAAKPFKLADGGGLYLFVTPAGGKLWRMDYRYVGKPKTLSFGKYPTVKLSDARDRRDAAKKLLELGRDPSEEKKAQKRRVTDALSQTFGVIAREFIAKQEAEGKSAATIKKARWMLEDLAAPLTDRPIAQISAAEILEALRLIEGKGNRESATRLRSSIGRVFAYAVATGRAAGDPTPALRGALLTPRVTHHPAITDPKGVGGLMRAIDGDDGTPVVRCALKIMALCFPRPGELRFAEWSEVDFEKAVWSIPAERMKMRRPHTIPLAPQAVKVFRDLHDLTGEGRLVCAGLRRSAIPISENTLNAALRRLGYTADKMTSHGFRTIASTLLNESGKWHPDAIERALAHQHGNAVRRAYARGEYWEERVRMAAWWADWLDALRDQKPFPNDQEPPAAPDDV